MKYFILAILLVVASFSHAADVELLRGTVVDAEALNFADSAQAKFSLNVNGRTYQRPPMATSRNYQYAVYYDKNRNVALGRRKLPDGAWNVIRFTDYTMPGSDSHNVVTLGICEGDGTIHLAFDHHADQLNYRVSEEGVASDPESVVWSTGLFGPVTDRLGSVGAISALTYPTFFNAPNGNLMLYYREGGSGDGDGMIQEYNGTTHNWTTGLGKFISRSGTYSGAYSSGSTSRCPYINGISYGGDRLHASWGWRETSVSAASNHDLNYAYSDDNGRTWRNNAGTVIGSTGSSYIRVDSPGLIVGSIPQRNDLSNQYTHYAYPDGSCHVMLFHYQAGTTTRRYHHYWRNASGTWSFELLSFTGSRPKLVGDDDGNLFLAYVTGGKPCIAKGVPNAGQTSWSWSQVYTQTDTTEGGEGQLDYSCWEEYRVLSFYGQETPTNDTGVPSALHVFDYKVSSKAILPVPVNGADVSYTEIALEWTAGIDASMHRVYLGTSRDAVVMATTASSEYQGEQGATVFTPTSVLPYPWTYYWRVDEVMADGTVVPGAIWEFTAVTDAPQHGLVAHWPLDEGSGILTTNLADSPYTATLENGAGWGSDGTHESYVVFDGENDRIATTFFYALADSDNFTWGWWANKQTPPGTDSGSIMVGSRYGDMGPEQYEFIKFTPVSVQFADTSSVGDIERYDYPDIPQGEWHHYAMVKNGSSYQWYVDGVAQGMVSNFNYSEESPIPFMIGGDGDNKPNEYFLGFIDDVVLYRSALSPLDLTNVMNGNYDLTVILTTLGTPVALPDATVWSDGLSAHSRANYIVPATGNLRSESGTSLFSGDALMVESDAKFQFLAKYELGEMTTVSNLILTGGSPADPVNLAAGTGNNTINHLGGTMRNAGFTKLSGYGNSTGPRNIRISSEVSGDGTLFSTGTVAYPHTCTIVNAKNSFSGVWKSNVGSLVFENAAAVGMADIEVFDQGELQILGEWNQGAALTVADSPTAQVDIGPYSWIVSSLSFGGTTVACGIYSASALNALGVNSVFSGNGSITVLPEGALFYSVTNDVAGAELWTCPVGISSVQVECWGGGGAGGSSSSTGAAGVYVAGGGGAGGCFANRASVPVTPGETYTLDVGVAALAADPATATSGQRVNGADIIFMGDNGVTVLAKGGAGGACVINPSVSTGGEGGSGDVAGCISDGSGSVFAGGDGFSADTKGGAGGGGAGDAANGEDAFRTAVDGDASTPGTGGLNGGGNGGQGANSVDHGGNGAHPGGGGGGARTGKWIVSSGDELLKSGGAGGLGQIIITYVAIPIIDPPTLRLDRTGGDFIFSWSRGDFKLQCCKDLVEAAWFDYEGGWISPVAISPTNDTAFFRLIEQ